MAFNLFKKPRIDENHKLLECCICGETGIYGFVDIFQISLRDNENSITNFSDVIFFTLDFNVEKESSDICAKCKPKIIEFYHFKRKSQSVQKKFSPLLQEIMKIVGNYLAKNSIKAVTIEESKDKLMIMEKGTVETSTNLKIAEVSSICDVQIKKESDEEESDITIPQIEIKKEPEDTPEIYELREMPFLLPFETNENHLENTISTTDPSEKLDTILSINKEILEVVRSLKQFKEQSLVT